MELNEDKVIIGLNRYNELIAIECRLFKGDCIAVKDLSSNFEGGFSSALQRQYFSSSEALKDLASINKGLCSDVKEYKSKIESLTVEFEKSQDMLLILHKKSMFGFVCYKIGGYFKNKKS